MNIRLKPFFIIFVLLLVPIVLLEAVLYYGEMWANRTTSEIQIRGHVAGQADQLAREIQSVVSDVMFLSENEEIMAFLDHGGDSQRKTLAKEYLTFSSHKGCYDQIRFLDDTGMEVVRVNFHNGQPAIVPRDRLQSKSKRYYFRDAFRLERGELFISPLDLNIEAGRIEQPLKPMIRFGTPVFDIRGRKRGIVLLNYLGSLLLEKLDDDVTHIPGEMMLLNDAGFWLAGADEELLWGFMYDDGDQNTFGHEYAEEWERISQTDAGQFRTGNSLFTFVTVSPLVEGQQSSTGARRAFEPSRAALDASAYHWKIVFHVSAATLAAQSHQTLRNMSAPFAGLILLALIVAALLTEYRTRHAAAKATVAHGERLLRHAETRYRQLLESMQLLAVILDRQGRITFCNNYVSESIGCSQDAVIGQDMFELLLPPEQRELSKQHFLRDIQQGVVTRQVENEIVTHTGERSVILWNNTPLTDVHGTVVGAACIGMDIADRKRMETELLQAKETALEAQHAAEAAQKDSEAAQQAAEAANTAKSAFIASISHELRTPLNAILGFSQAMRNKGGLSQKYQENLDIIHQRGEDLLALINRMIDIARIEDAPAAAERIDAVLKELQQGDGDQKSDVVRQLETNKFAAGLTELSSGLLADLEQAILNVDVGQIYRLIERIRAQDAALADALKESVDNFEYETILTLIR